MVRRQGVCRGCDSRCVVLVHFHHTAEVKRPDPNPNRSPQKRRLEWTHTGTERAYPCTEKSFHPSRTGGESLHQFIPWVTGSASAESCEDLNTSWLISDKSKQRVNVALCFCLSISSSNAGSSATQRGSHFAANSLISPPLAFVQTPCS